MARPADADGASYRTVCRRRDADIRFLAELRTVRSLDHLKRIEERERKWGMPQWRRVAIDRARERIRKGAKT